MRGNLPEAYKLSLNKMLADEPDFLIDLGDTFFTDPYVRGGRETSEEEVYGRVELLRSYFDLTTHSVPCFWLTATMRESGAVSSMVPRPI